MAGWDAARRIALRAPWSEFSIEAYTDLEIGVWLDFQEAWELARADPRAERIETVVGYFARLIRSHDIVTRDGEPLVITLRSLTPDLTKALVEAISAAQEGDGAADDPFESRAPSPVPSSPKSPSRRASRSTGSRARRA